MIFYEVVLFVYTSVCDTYPLRAILRFFNKRPSQISFPRDFLVFLLIFRPFHRFLLPSICLISLLLRFCPSIHSRRTHTHTRSRAASLCFFSVDVFPDVEEVNTSLKFQREIGTRKLFLRKAHDRNKNLDKIPSLAVLILVISIYSLFFLSDDLQSSTSKNARSGISFKLKKRKTSKVKVGRSPTKLEIHENLYTLLQERK